MRNQVIDTRPRAWRTPACWATGLLLLAAFPFSHAQVPTGSELGDPALGLVADINVMGADQPSAVPQGTLLIAPLQRNPARDPGVLRDVLANERGDPPRRAFRRYEIWVNNQRYETTRVHPWNQPFYTSALPFAPQAVKVTALLSTGELFSTTVDVPESLQLDRAIDIRADEISKPSPMYGDRKRQSNAASPATVLVAPYRDQAAYWLGDVIGEGRSMKIHVACFGSTAAGRVVHTRLAIKQHYYFSPEGEMTLMETDFHQPVFGSDQSIDFGIPVYWPNDGKTFRATVRQRRPDDPGSDAENKYPAQFVFECRTESGKTLRREFEYHARKSWR